LRNPGEVGVAVGVGVLRRVADTGLGGEVGHRVEFGGTEKLRGLGAVGDVEEGECELRISLEAFEARFLESDVVVGAEVVDAVD
jgi:hypothetical protein